MRNDDGEPRYTCPFCGMTSYNPHDAEQRYCGACHRFSRRASDRLYGPTTGVRVSTARYEPPGRLRRFLGRVSGGKW